MSRCNADRVRYELSASALAYLKDQLWASRGLEEPLFEALHSREWRAWTRATSATDTSRLGRYAEAIGTGEYSDADAVEAICDALVGGGSAWIIAHPYARPNDPFLSRERTAYTALEDAVYYVGDRADRAAIATAWRRAKSEPATIGIVTKARISLEELTPELLERAASGVCLVVLRAYDGERAIVFQPATE